MSDTGDGSDDFDKEAEREKLREKYEQDKKRREATQQMSELLLKGATMTNSHCDDCGSPIFRYEGEAFCPTCAGTRGVAEGEAAGDAGEGQPGDDGRPAGAGQGAPEQQDAGQAGGGQADDGRSAGQPESSAADAGGQVGAGQTGGKAPSGRSSPDPSGEAASGAGGGRGDARDELGEDDLEAMRSRLDERAASRSPGAGGSTDRRRDPPRSSDSAVRSGEVPSMAQSRASLRRAIVSLSEQAAQSDDPGRAHNLLKGAREAAEALAALEGTTGE